MVHRGLRRERHRGQRSTPSSALLLPAGLLSLLVFGAAVASPTSPLPSPSGPGQGYHLSGGPSGSNSANTDAINNKINGAPSRRLTLRRNKMGQIEGATKKSAVLIEAQVSEDSVKNERREEPIFTGDVETS